MSHTITSGKVTDNNAGSLFDSGLIKSGGEFRFTFQNPGTYNYFCTVHPWMVGQVVVAGSTPTPPPVTSILLQVSTDKNSYSPGDFVTVNAGESGSSPGQNIAVNVIDSTGSAVISRTVTTNDQNNANLQFKLSSSASTGTYQVIVTASSNGNSYKQSTQFTVQQPIAQVSIMSVQATDQQGNPVTSFSRGTNGFVKVVLSSQSSHSALTTVNLFGSDSTSIGIGSFKTTLSQGQSEMILSFYIPNNAATGTANIYADVDSDWPSKGGTPLTSESASTVEVQ